MYSPQISCLILFLSTGKLRLNKKHFPTSGKVFRDVWPRHAYTPLRLLATLITSFHTRKVFL